MEARLLKWYICFNIDRYIKALTIKQKLETNEWHFLMRILNHTYLTLITLSPSSWNSYWWKYLVFDENCSVHYGEYRIFGFISHLLLSYPNTKCLGSKPETLGLFQVGSLFCHIYDEHIPQNIWQTTLHYCIIIISFVWMNDGPLINNGFSRW